MSRRILLLWLPDHETGRRAVERRVAAYLGLPLAEARALVGRVPVTLPCRAPDEEASALVAESWRSVFGEASAQFVGESNTPGRARRHLFNRKAPRSRWGHIETMSTFFHPLDAVGAWNRVYGRRGFLQYQFAVPFDAAGVVQIAIERLAEGGMAPCLAVLKRFGAGDPGPLSFPIEGWTLALDVPVGQPALSAVLDGLDEVVASCGGRVYLAKDSRMRPAMMAAMYPRLQEWRAVKRTIDPDGVLTSDLARRLDLS